MEPSRRWGAFVTGSAPAALLVLTFVLALIFLALGIGKLRLVPALVERADHLGIDHDLFRLVGVPEIAASCGLVIGLAFAPLAVAADLGLALLLVGALLATARAHAAAKDFVPACAVLVLVGAHLWVTVATG